MISRSTHGLPWAARPTITALAPVVASTACARARDVTSPDAITGTSTSVDELGRQRVVGGARVHLLRRARVQRQRRGAGVDEARTDVEAGARAVLEPAAHLHADGEVDGVRDRVDDPARAVGIVEERRAGAGLRHLADGAAEVDVDDVGARRRRPCARPPPSAPARSRRSAPRAGARPSRSAGSRASARCRGEDRRS